MFPALISNQTHVAQSPGMLWAHVEHLHTGLKRLLKPIELKVVKSRIEQLL
jgi:hypothetical protein